MSRLVFLGSRRQAGASTVTRALQIAPRVGGVVNPWRIRADDVVVMVKRLDWRAVDRAREVYCDINDDVRDLPAIATRPDIRIIALTPSAAEWIRARVPNPVTCVPIQHCNFEGRRRAPGPVRRVVISGDRFVLDRAEVRRRLTAVGLELVEVPGQSPREEHCAALAQGDLALAYCPEPPAARYPLAIKPPLKFANAASFGVPFVAWPEPALAPFADAYAAVQSLDELVDTCCRLRDDPVEYARLVAAGFAAAEPFHIDRVAAAWRALLPP